jgi:hypothetical protein
MHELLTAVSYSKGKFTLDEIEFIQSATVSALVAAVRGELDLNLIAREELAARGLDENGVWIGFEKARRIARAETNKGPPPETTGG